MNKPLYDDCIDDDEYILYLRKSRLDRDYADESVETTLRRHEERLTKFAKERGYHITKIFREVVSGESIASRPEMLKVLNLVETKKYKGVICTELTRLSRGDGADTALVQNVFKYSNTVIATPDKVYDFDDEMDEDYTDWQFLASKKEFKVTKKRLVNGRISSATEGKYVGSVPPYGYDRVKIPKEKGYTLKINEEQAKIVRLIFDLYVNGEVQEDGTVRMYGVTALTTRLYEMGIRDEFGLEFKRHRIFRMLRNEHYIGMIPYQKRRVEKEYINGEIVKKRSSILKEHMINKGLHEAIIDEKTFYAAQALLDGRSRPSVKGNVRLQNPLAGLIFCGYCGNTMTRHTGGHGPTYQCKGRECKCIGAYTNLVESRVITSLNAILTSYEVSESDGLDTVKEMFASTKKSLESSNTTLKQLQAQLTKAYDMLEQEIYDTDTFVERSTVLKNKISTLKKEQVSTQVKLDNLQKILSQKQSFVPKVRNILEVYNDAPNAEYQNRMLREVIDKIEYRKERKGADSFEITVFPKLL